MRIALIATTAVFALLAGCGQSENSGSRGDFPSPKPIILAGLMPPISMTPVRKSAARKVMHERHEGMEQIGKATKAAGRALKSSPPDVAVIRTSAATIARLAPRTTAWFPAGTGPTVGKTGAKAEIWAKPADFAARSLAFEQAAVAFNAAARTGDAGAMQARFGALAKTCKGCHDSYRSEMKP